MKKKPALNKIAGFLAFVIGAMAIFAGGQIILGILPDYYVIDWLPIYNFAIGIVSVFFYSDRNLEKFSPGMAIRPGNLQHACSCDGRIADSLPCSRCTR